MLTMTVLHSLLARCIRLACPACNAPIVGTKPIDPRELFTAINAVLQLKQTDEAA